MCFSHSAQRTNRSRQIVVKVCRAEPSLVVGSRPIGWRNSRASCRSVNPCLLNPAPPLGPYSVTAPIGAGGMGEVYRAHDTKLDRDVALKVPPDALASDPDRLARRIRTRQSGNARR